MTDQVEAPRRRDLAKVQPRAGLFDQHDVARH
jgi:hypothetical protein